MPPERTLTDADIDAIVKVISQNHCMCSFSDDEVSAIRDLLTVLRETRSNIMKGIITVLVGGFFVIVAMGFKAWSAK
jgi:hypothetical protein